MPRRKNNKRFYLVLSSKRKHQFGAFPFSPEGKKTAVGFIEVLQKENKEEYFLAER